ncbi:MAG: hypothetical protein S0880_05025 [Actinomycetota bacterium]|nr:hypothetical protein [Actinomycetota bacterium]
MPKVRISGRVVYDNNATPAAGVEVHIYDDDHGRDDTIVRERTDAYGCFSGVGEWRDELLELLPEFRYAVRANGQVFRGLYFHPPAGEGRIMLPEPPPCPVPAEARELVVVSALGGAHGAWERWLCEALESLAVAKPQTILGSHYRDVRVVNGPKVTMFDVVDALEEAAGVGGTKAVDALVIGHGLHDGSAVFAGEQYTPEDIALSLRAIPEERRRRLRALLTTASWGRRQLNGWFGGGFSVVAGARGLTVDAPLSYEPFLRAWANGRTFRESVSAANANREGIDYWDALAEARYQDLEGEARDADSRRVVVGTARMTICSNP